ncbi:MAG: ribokinase [Steroidobacter sp.]
MPARIVVVGSLNMDLVLAVPRAPEAGETVTGRQLSFVPGGKGANQAVACARLGGTVAMIGRVGADEFGARLRDGLARDRVAVEQVSVDPTVGTGTALIMVDDQAQNRIALIPAANHTLTPTIMEQMAAPIDAASLVLLQLEIPLPTVEWVIARAAAAKAQVILNPAPAQALPASIWSRVDYIVPNESEAAMLTGIDVTDVASATAAANEMRRRGARHVLLTLGSKGVLIADAAGTRTHPAPKVKAVDTTAAGDTFIGALAAMLSEGKDLDAAARFAVEAASLSVTRAGAQPSIPYRHEIQAI